MPISPKPAIVALVSALTFVLGAAPAAGVPTNFVLSTPTAPQEAAAADVVPTQTLSASTSTIDGQSLDALTALNDVANIPHGFDVAATIAQAESEVGTSRATGWSQPGECIISARRWIHAGGGAWTGHGNPVSNYVGATRLTMKNAQPGDIVQYENIAFPTSFVSGIHTLLITEVHGDGTFTIIESNNPGGSGLVSKNTSWVPAPPAGFAAVVWRF